VACLEDEGFDFSVLSDFRALLVAGDLERRSWTFCWTG